MKRLFCVLLALSMLAFLSFWSAIPVGAQEEDEDVFQLEEITVTAEKRSENLQDVARSVVAIGADELNIRSADQVQEMIQNTAGISFVTGGPWLNHIGMRGVIPNTAETGSEASVQFSVDGNVALTNEGSISPMFSAMNDVERIEVIRGPSGAISGRMAAAGSIRVVTKDPDFEKYDGYTGFTIGNYDTRNAKAALNVPLKASGLELPSYLENIAVRFAIRQDKHSEYIVNAAGEGVRGSTDFLTWRTKLKWEPFEDLTIDLQTTYNREKSNNGNTVPLINDGGSPHPDEPWVDANASAANTPNESIQWSESATVNWLTSLGNVTGRYSHSWIPVDCDEGGGGGPPGGVCYDGEKFQKEYEIYMTSPEDSKLQWTVGAYMFEKKEYTGPDEAASGVDLDNLDITFGNFYGGTGGPPGSSNAFTEAGWDPNSISFPANNPELWLPDVGLFGGEVTGDSIYYYSDSKTRPIDSFSYYGNITIPFMDETMRLTLGYRQTIEKKKRQVTFAVIGSDVVGDMPNFVFDDGDTIDGDGQWVTDNFNTIYYEEAPTVYNTDEGVQQYTLGLEYDLRDEVMLYANVNTGFKPGGISLNAIPNVFYDKEESINYALGTRSRWLDNRLQLNAEAYLMSYDGYQINIAAEGVLTNTFTVDDDGTQTQVTYTQPYRFQSRTMNMGPTDIYGLEIDYDYLITSKDRIKGNFEYKHAEYGELDIDRGVTANPPGSAQFVSYGGRPMQNAPKFTFYTSYSHTFTIQNITATPTLDARYSDKYFCNSEPWWEVMAPNEIWQDAYWKFDAYLNIAPTDGNWTVNVYGKNLTETVIRNLVGWSAAIDNPRTYGVTFTVNF